jgi:hypothetical protein
VLDLPRRTAAFLFRMPRNTHKGVGSILGEASLKLGISGLWQDLVENTAARPEMLLRWQQGKA